MDLTAPVPSETAPATAPVVALHRSEDGVATVTLNRPQRLNALNRPMWPALTEHFNTLSADSSVRCVVVTGAGKAFSPGADISEFATERPNSAAAAAYGAVMDTTYRAIEGCPHPIIAAIRGPCTGAGLVLALKCDLRIASRTAKFGAAVARLGLAMPYPEFKALFQAVGRTVAMEMVLEATVLDADAALAKGLISRIVPDETFEAAIAETIGRVTAGAPLVHRWHKEFARRLSDPQPLTDAEIAASYASFSTADYQEGFQAFLGKRKPMFRGT